MLNRLFSKSRRERAVAALYGRIVERARDPAFFTEGGVPDTLEGRFELIALHAGLVMRRLGREPRAAEFNQALFDFLFADLDLNLREMGVGDMGVGKKVKSFAEHFMGRLRAYDEALSAGAGPDALAAALDRNLFGSTLPDPAAVERMALHVRDLASRLDRSTVDELMAGGNDFEVGLDAGADRVRETRE